MWAFCHGLGDTQGCFKDASFMSTEWIRHTPMPGSPTGHRGEGAAR